MAVMTVDRIALHYERSGTVGDPAVLIHGSWSDAEVWVRVVPALSQGLQVLTYDRRGYRESHGPPRDRPVSDDASDLATLLKRTDQYPTHLIGQGYGGIVALRLALDRPELVRSVCAHEPPYVGLLEDWEPAREGPMPPTAPSQSEDALRASDARGPAERASSGPGPGGRGPRARTDVTAQRWAGYGDRWAEESADPDTRRPDEGIRSIDTPILLTYGEIGPPTYRAMVERLAGQLRNATVCPLPSAGRLPELTDPETFVGVLATFLLERDVPST